MERVSNTRKSTASSNLLVVLGKRKAPRLKKVVSCTAKEAKAALRPLLWAKRSLGSQMPAEIDFRLRGQKSNLKRFVISDAQTTTSRGCSVEITNVHKDFEIRGEQGFAEQIRDIFALQLYENLSFEIIYDGDRIDARDAIREVTPYDLVALLPDGTEVTANWKSSNGKPVERKLMLCLQDGLAFCLWHLASKHEDLTSLHI